MVTTQTLRQPERSLRIIVVDDDEEVRTALEYLLGASGHEVRLFASAEDFLADDVDADCFVLDVCLPKMSGIELAEQIRSARSEVPIILMTGQDREPIRRAIAGTGLRLLSKPCDSQEILDAVADARR
jgi:FixJ family two-component response regulator